MNKKAFTLIEMIAAIIIMSILAVLVTVSLKNVLNKNTEKKYDEFKREVEQAACVFIDLSVNSAFKSTCYSSGECNVTVKRLVTDGLISEKLVDPQTDEVIDQTKVVKITWVDHEKKCTLQ